MKIERIIEIIFYLMNHENVSASVLAEHFHVTVRTIQRDMTTIAESGIPVFANLGKTGGYSVVQSYKLKNAHIKEDEQQLIAKALESLSTSYTNEKLSTLIEKYNAVVDRENNQKVFWDFGVTKENDSVQKTNTILENAIGKRSIIKLLYIDGKGEKSNPEIEPLAIHYKWYSWYLFAYRINEKDYHTYKVARIHDITFTDRSSSVKHDDLKKLMSDSENAYYKTCETIEVLFNINDLELMNEYFLDSKIETVSEDTKKIFISVPTTERLWKALLLSFGSKVKIIKPESYRDELIKTSKDFLSNYDI